MIWKSKRLLFIIFRSIKDQELILVDYSVLFGQNNAGKTNIVNAIRSFFDPVFESRWNDLDDFLKFKTDDEESWVQVCFSMQKQQFPDHWKEFKKFISNDKKQQLVIKKYFKSKKIDTNNNTFFFIKDEKEELCWENIEVKRRSQNFLESWEFGTFLYVDEKKTTNYLLIKEILSNIRDFECSGVNAENVESCSIENFNEYLKNKTKNWKK